MIKSTYLCGGIAGLSDDQCNQWRSYAKDFLCTSTRDPMVRDCRGKEGDIDANWLIKADVEDIFNSDFLLVNASKPSWGTAMEIVYAHFLKKPIVAFLKWGANTGSKSPWLVYHCDYITNNLSEAVKIINAKV